jgi:hypothetical protein
MPYTDIVDWLLDAETPSIRYLTMRDVLKLSDTDTKMQSDQQAIMIKGPVPVILAKQTATGQWADEQSYYTPKYVSTHWSLTLLTELCVDQSNRQFQQGVEYMLTATTERMRESLMNQDHGFSCFWGNLLRYALYAGRYDDARVQSIIDYAVHDLSNGHCQCQHNDGYSCAWGVVRTLWGLTALPPESRTLPIQSAIDQALTFLLDSFSLIEANYPTPDNGKTHPMWFKLNFPLFYQVDILFTLRVLMDLDALDHPAVAKALDWLETLRQKNDTFRGSSPYRQRTWRELGDTSETARWVSLFATSILQKAGRLEVRNAL